MKSAFVVLGAIAGSAIAQGVTDKISPDGLAPEGCTANYDGTFEISIAQVVGAAKRGIQQKRAACSGDGILVSTLTDGVISDAKDRIGYVASNYQFQFDGPPQAGAIYTAGFTVCGNGSIALGSSTTFWMCKSGDFYNLYDRSWAAQCSPAELIVLPCGGDAAASQAPDGQVVGTQIVTTTVVKPLSDGQPQVITTTVPVPICQIGDGQVQAVTTPCASITSVAPTSIPAPFSQYSDGQIQVTVPATVAPTGTASVPVAPPSGTATVVLPTESAPSSIITSLATVSSAAPTATTSVVVAAAGRAEMGSVAALAVGVVGVVAML